MTPTHLDEEQVQRVLHRELGSAHAEVESHLRDCLDCRARLNTAEQEEDWIFEQFRRLDHPAPEVNVIVPARRRARPWQRVAAGIVLAVAAAGLAYAAPLSPLPKLVHRVIELLHRPDPRPKEPPVRSPMPESQAGIAVSPGDRLAIVFSAPGGEATVRLTDASEVMVRALDGANFTSAPDRLIIEGKAQGRFDIQIPRHAPRVEILVGARRVLLKDHAAMVTGAVPDAEGRYRIRLDAQP